MLAHGSSIVNNLLEMATTCDDAADNTPSMKDQVTELAKVKLEDHHIKYHLYKVISPLRAMCKAHRYVCLLYFHFLPSFPHKTYSFFPYHCL